MSVKYIFYNNVIPFSMRYSVLIGLRNSHNYMFQPILGHLQVVPYSLASVVA